MVFGEIRNLGVAEEQDRRKEVAQSLDRARRMRRAVANQAVSVQHLAQLELDRAEVIAQEWMVTL